MLEPIVKVILTLLDGMFSILVTGIFYKIGIQNDGYVGRNYYAVSAGIILYVLAGILAYGIWEMWT